MMLLGLPASGRVPSPVQWEITGECPGSSFHTLRPTVQAPGTHEPPPMTICLDPSGTHIIVMLYKASADHARAQQKNKVWLATVNALAAVASS